VDEHRQEDYAVNIRTALYWPDFVLKAAHVQCFSISITVYVGLGLPFGFTSLNLRGRITISLDMTDP
jgi:hypothetical protein